MDEVKDVLIVGAGPAGLSAAIYLIRSGYEVTLFEKGFPGGKVNLTAEVENYPGIEKISGPDLAFKIYEHALNIGAKIFSKEVKNIIKENEVFKVFTDKEMFSFKSIIVATGTTENKLEVENSMKFENHGISYCAVCDGRFYKDKEVAVIGGGNAALEEALYLEKICSKVHLIHRRDEFRADKIIIDLVEKSSIDILYDTIVTKVNGDNSVSDVELLNKKTNEVSKLEISGIFPYIGAKPNTQFLDSSLLDEKGYLLVNEKMETKLVGLYGCGDVIKKELRQVVTATSDGAIAAINVANYLKK
ncbi:MAG: thioredoxin-disulfide reductase [Bacilli bacterium]